MAIQTRYVGDALPVINVDAGLSSPAASTATVIATGLTKTPTAIAIAQANVGVAGEMVTGGAVETILRAIAVDSTVVMYQVDSGLISVLVEATGNTAAGIQTRLRALPGAASGAAGPTGTTAGGNIGISANVWAAALTVTNVGFKLATS